MLDRTLMSAAIVATVIHAAPALAGSEKPMSNNVHDLTVTNIDGASQSLGQYKGKVLLIVNVASQCGYTPQYTGLEKLWQDYKAKGVVVLGFPSNDFGEQEPGSEAEIKKFCSLKYNVTFPLFSKVKTHGDGQAPLYKILGEKGEPKWNFTKYVVGKDGRVRQMFPSKVTPESAELRGALDEALK